MRNTHPVIDHSLKFGFDITYLKLIDIRGFYIVTIFCRNNFIHVSIY